MSHAHLAGLVGSLPDAVWTRTLGLPSFVTPYANHDEANHAPNENMEVARFYAGVRTTAALLAELAAPKRELVAIPDVSDGQDQDGV
jgi:hypothetical protein